MYKLYQPTIGDQIIMRLSDMACIPMNPDNTDYQAYLRWLEEGGQPLPAEENQ